jgi:hypothetical protein
MITRSGVEGHSYVTACVGVWSVDRPQEWSGSLLQNWHRMATASGLMSWSALLVHSSQLRLVTRTAVSSQLRLVTKTAVSSDWWLELQSAVSPSEKSFPQPFSSFTAMFWDPPLRYRVYNSWPPLLILTHTIPFQRLSIFLRFILILSSQTKPLSLKRSSLFI